MKWKTLKSEYLIKRPWLTARKDEVQLPTGVINKEYYVLEYPDWINVIEIDKNGKMIFIRQYRYALGETSFEIVAGVIEKGEEPLAAAKRELKEETGYAGGEWKDIMTLSPNPSTNTNLCHCFLATDVECVGTQNLDVTEDIEVFVMDKEKVLTMLRHNDIKQALMAAPLWWFFANNK